MNSLPTKEYASLPKLDPPAGYICVLRDIDRDVYRIDSTDRPRAYVDALLAELTGTYGIELISILETDDLAASESQLFDAHHARLSDEWLNLDNHQLAELRRSELQIYAHRSLYLRPQSDSTPRSAANKRPVSRYGRSAASYSRASAQRTRRRASRSSLAHLGNDKEAQRRRVRLEDVDDPFALLQYLRDRLQPMHEILYRMKETVLDYMLLWLFVAFVFTIVLLVLVALGLSFGDGPIGLYWN